ncbi:MAG: ABC transporter substrate-binding protein [Actinomycetota bacterium]
MLRSRRTPVALAFALALTAAACGGDADDSASSSDDESVGAASAAESEPGADEAAPNSEPAAEAGDADDDPADRPLIGPDSVVVDLGDNLFDLALYDVVVAGNIYGEQYLAPEVDDVNGLSPEVAQRLAAAPLIGGADFNAEFIAALEPDLIILSPFAEEFFGTDGTLEQIAEVVVVDDDQPWQDRSRTIAALVGREEEAELRIAAAEQSIQDLKQRVADAELEGSSVVFMRYVIGQFAVFSQPSLFWEIVDEIGWTFPETADVQQPDNSPFPGYSAQLLLTEEFVVGLDADFVFVGNVAPGADPFSEFPETYPVETLSAFGTDRVDTPSYFLWALNSMIAVEEIVEGLNHAVDILEAQG